MDKYPCPKEFTNCSSVTYRKFSERVIQRSEAPPSRSSILTTVWSMCPQVFFTDRMNSIKFAGDLRATHPHFVYVPHHSPQALHNAGPLVWGSGLRGGMPAYTGMDMIIVRDQKIAALNLMNSLLARYRKIAWIGRCSPSSHSLQSTLYLDNI